MVVEDSNSIFIYNYICVNTQVGAVLELDCSSANYLVTAEYYVAEYVSLVWKHIVCTVLVLRENG